VAAAVRYFAALFLGLACCVAASGLAGTLVALRLARDGAVGPTLAGLVLAAFSAGLMLGSRFSERVIRRVGHIRSFAVFAATTSATMLLIGINGSPWVWFVARGVYGFCMGGLYVTAESWVGDRARGGAVGGLGPAPGTVFAAYMIITQLALAGGQLLVVPVGDASLPDGFVVAGMLLAIALVPVALTTTSQPILEATSPLPLWELARRVPLAMVGSVAAGGTVGSLMGLGPMFARGLGWPDADVGNFMATLVASGLVLQWPLGQLSDRLDRRLVLSGSSLALVAASTWLALLVAERSPSYPLLLVAAGLVGSVGFVLYPLSLAHAGDYLAPREAVAANATLVSAYGVGAAAGPWVGTELARAVGPLSLPIVLGVFGLVPALFGIYRRFERRPAAAGDRVTYYPVALPSASALSELDPRGEPEQLFLSFEDDEGTTRRLQSLRPPSPSAGGYPEGMTRRPLD